MDKKQFEEKTRNLLQWSDSMEKHVVKSIKIELCGYCHNIVENQRIVCDAYKLGQKDQHFKHKCLTCRKYVFDGSRRHEEQFQLRPISPNYVLTKKKSV